MDIIFLIWTILEQDNTALVVPENIMSCIPHWFMDPKSSNKWSTIAQYAYILDSTFGSDICLHLIEKSNISRHFYNDCIIMDVEEFKVTILQLRLATLPSISTLFRLHNTVYCFMH